MSTTTDENGKTLRVAVIGLWGHEIYARQLLSHPAVQLVALGEGNDTPAQMRKRLCDMARDRQVPFEPDVALLIRRHKPDICLIMVPPCQADAVTEIVLSSGIHVLTEKPIAGNLEAVRRLAHLAAGKNVHIGACLPLPKYSPVYQQAKERVLAGEIGSVLQASFTYLANKGPLYIAAQPHYRDHQLPSTSLSGGETAMFSGYGVVALEWLTGSRIASVFARVGSYFYPSYQQRAMEDMASVVIKFENGTVGSMTTGRTPSPSAPTVIGFSLTGTKGNLAYGSNQAPGVIDVYGAYTGGDGRTGDAGGARQVAIEPEIQVLTHDFVDAILEGRTPLLSTSEVISTMEVLAAIYLSGGSGEEVSVSRI